MFCCFVGPACFVRLSAAERVALVRASDSTVRLHCIMNADLFIADMVTMRLESIEERRGEEKDQNLKEMVVLFFGGGGGGGRGVSFVM